MTDTDHLAALLHGWTCGTLRTDEWDVCIRDHRQEAKWLIAAGVTLAPTPPDALDAHPGQNHDYRMTCLRCGEPGYLFVGFHSRGETYRWSEAQPPLDIGTDPLDVTVT